MKKISFRLDDKLFAETERLVKISGIDRSEHINEALRFYHSHTALTLLKTQLSKESILVRANSLEVLRDLELIEN